MNRELSHRSQDILRILISDYIATADPVGSRTIAKKYPGHISPATIRNVMSDLTEMGLLCQPHTSAGRIPTKEGMRYFVSALLKKRDLTDKEMEIIKNRCFGDEKGVGSVLARTSKMLAAVSRYAGLVVSPSTRKVVFKQIEFVPLSGKRLLGILVSKDGTVENRIIELDESITYPEIERMTNFCNRCFSGLTLESALEKIERELADDRADYDRLLKKAIIYSKQVMSELPLTDVMIEGEFQLMEMPEFREASKFKKLMEALEEKQKVLKLLERCRDGEGVRIFIGSDSPEELDSIGIVGAPYFGDGEVVGMLGVIGPMRMDYSSVVPIVDFTAKVLGDVLEI